jgi:hypothetical protein
MFFKKYKHYFSTELKIPKDLVEYFEGYDVIYFHVEVRLNFLANPQMGIEIDDFTIPNFQKITYRERFADFHCYYDHGYPPPETRMDVKEQFADLLEMGWKLPKNIHPLLEKKLRNLNFV